MTDTATPIPSTPAPAPKKKSLGRLIKRLFLMGVLLVVVLLVVLFLSLNTLVRMGVIRGGTYATSQNTDLDTANLSLSQGVLQLSGFGIDNPANEGYSAPKLITMKSCDVQVDTGSLFSHTVQVKEINLDGLEVWLEQNGMKNNLSEIMAAVQKNTAAAGNAPPASGGGSATSSSGPGASPGKELKIGKLSLTATKVHVVANGIKLDLTLPPLTIEDPTNPDGRPLKIADLIGTVLLQLSKEILDNPQLPGNMKDALKNVNAIVDNLKGQLDKGVKLIGPDLGKSLQGADPSKGLQDMGKNIGNLLNQKKDPQK